jgi:polysaccharide biosynthesis/export protein
MMAFYTQRRLNEQILPDSDTPQARPRAYSLGGALALSLLVPALLSAQTTAAKPSQSQPLATQSGAAPASGKGASSSQPTAKPATPPPASQQAPAPTASPSTIPVKPASTAPAGAVAAAATPPGDYIIGPDDILQVVFWREKDLSAEVVVRPDGKISLSLLNDVQAAGLTPDQLRQSVTEAAGRFVTDPSVTVVVKAINSRKVFVTGMVNKPGTYALNDKMTILQMLAVAGGLSEFAKGEEIVVMRNEQGQTKSFKFNYKDVRKGKNLEQNVALRPGDTIVVP